MSRVLRLPSYHAEFNPIEKNYGLLSRTVLLQEAQRRGLGNTKKFYFFLEDLEQPKKRNLEIL
jgi:hypothetical protein